MINDYRPWFVGVLIVPLLWPQKSNWFLVSLFDPLAKLPRTFLAQHFQKLHVSVNKKNIVFRSTILFARLYESIQCLTKPFSKNNAWTNVQATRRWDGPVNFSRFVGSIRKSLLFFLSLSLSLFFFLCFSVFFLCLFVLFLVFSLPFLLLWIPFFEILRRRQVTQSTSISTRTVYYEEHVSHCFQLSPIHLNHLKSVLQCRTVWHLGTS